MAIDNSTPTVGLPPDRPPPHITTETETGQKSIAERIEAICVDLFDSMAMVDVAARAVSPDHDWCLRHTLEVAGRRIDDGRATLELIGGDAGSNDAHDTTHAAIVADVGRAYLSIEQVDALISTAAAAIAGGDFQEDDVVRVLQDFAWPEIDRARQAIERIREQVGAERGAS